MAETSNHQKKEQSRRREYRERNEENMQEREGKEGEIGRKDPATQQQLSDSDTAGGKRSG